MRECPSGKRVQRCKPALSEVSRSHISEKNHEGLNVKVRERTYKVLQKRQRNPKHVRELLA